MWIKIRLKWKHRENLTRWLGDKYLYEKQTVLTARQRKFFSQACIMTQGKVGGSILSLFKILLSVKILFVLIPIFVYRNVRYWAQKRKRKLITQNENMLFDSRGRDSYFVEREWEVKRAALLILIMTGIPHPTDWVIFKKVS